MRAAAKCMLLLLVAGLLAGVAESYSVKGVLNNPVPVQKPQVVVKGQLEDSHESLEDDTVRDPDYVPDYDQLDDDDDYEDYYYYYDDDYSEENDINSHEDDGSFIASEETNAGKLWISDEDPDWQPSHSHEHESYEGDDSQEHDDSQEYVFTYGHVDSHQNDSSHGDTFPVPEVTVHDWSDSHQHNSQVKGKRSVKQSYQARQQEQVSAPYGSEQDRIDSWVWGSIQDGSGGLPGVSTGVEPLQPVGGPQHHEVAVGVVPEREGSAGYEDKEPSGGILGGLFKEGWRRFTGTVENLGGRAEDAFTSLGEKVEDAAGSVHETLSGAVDGIYQGFESVARKVPQLLERFKALILKFGTVIQEGARYCLTRFEHAVDQVRESLVIEKLEEKLEEGHAEVAQFFQILGEKVQAWREKHGSAHVDAGLIDGYKPVDGQTQQEGPHRQDFEDMPDFFQDQQVVVHLNKLKESGVLTFDDVQILTQEHNSLNKPLDQNQDQQNQQQNYYSQQQRDSHATSKVIVFPDPY